MRINDLIFIKYFVNTHSLCIPGIMPPAFFVELELIHVYRYGRHSTVMEEL